MKNLCIYHGNCADGFGAAWAVLAALAALGDEAWEFMPATHQDPPPDVIGRHVIIVDFSYKRPVLEQMTRTARSLLVLDHHKSAAEDLADLPSAGETYAEWLDNGDEVGALFDMDRSGAGIAWDFFHDASRPPLLDHIEDRDLWRFALPRTRDIQANLFSHPYNFELWTDLMERSRDEEWLERFATEGAAIERKHHKDVAELVKVTTRMMRIGGHVVPMANLPYTMTSDAGHLLADDHPFAGCYWDTPNGRVFSLRSLLFGADVSAIAAQYGGGGHRNAAGFRVPFDQLGQFEL